MLDVVLRPAVITDAPELARMAQALAEHDGEGTSDFSQQAILLDVFGEQPACWIWVGEAAGRLAGFVMAYPGYDMLTASRGWHLGDLWVEPSHRRYGLGTALVHRLAAESGSWISLTRSQHNHAAAAFYRKLGFVWREDVCFHAIGSDGLALWRAQL